MTPMMRGRNKRRESRDRRGRGQSHCDTMLAPRKKLWSAPSEAILKAINVMAITKKDVVVDVGAGDGKFIVQCGLLSPAKDVIGIEINADRVEEANIKMKETFIAHYTLYNEQKMHSQEQGPTEKSALAGAQSPQSQKIKQETSSSSLLPFTGTKSQSTSTPTYTATPIAAVLSPAVQTAYETFSARCRMVACNALDYDYSQVTCMFLYLIPRGLRIFLPYIQKQKQTIKIISFQNQLVPGLKEQSTSGDDDDSRGENGENEKDAAKCDSSSSGNGDDDDDERDGSFAKIVLVKKYYITTAALPDIRYPMYYYLVNP